MIIIIIIILIILSFATAYVLESSIFLAQKFFRSFAVYNQQAYFKDKHYLKNQCCHSNILVIGLQRPQ